VPKTGTQHSDQLQGELRLVLQQANEIAAINRDQLAIRHRGCGRRARTSVEQRDLAEDLALLD
jgi:hypothetical protein